MFKKTVHELFRCKGSRLFVILMLVNFALSCIGISASFMSYAMGVNVSRVILEMTTRLMGTTCESFERGPWKRGSRRIHPIQRRGCMRIRMRCHRLS